MNFIFHMSCGHNATREVFDWWMEDKNIDGQYSMDFDGIDLIGFNEKGI